VRARLRPKAGDVLLIFANRRQTGGRETT